MPRSVAKDVKVHQNTKNPNTPLESFAYLTFLSNYEAVPNPPKFENVSREQSMAKLCRRLGCFAVVGGLAFTAAAVTGLTKMLASDNITPKFTP